MNIFVVPGSYTVVGGCWEWNGARDKHGYGTRRIGPRGDNKNWFAHRLSYYEHYGEIDDELYVLHKCDNPCCVNPEHLYQGTHQDNMDDVRDRKRSVGSHSHQIGENAPNVKLKVEDVLLIRELYNMERKLKPLALKFEVSTGAIAGIVYNKTWRHV